MYLFLPEGVLSITAHKEEPYNLKVRALDPAVIEKHLTCTVYYDGEADMPYHGTIMRAQLQALITTHLETMSYAELPTEGNGHYYGTLLKLVNRAINFYPDLEITRRKYGEEPEHVVPEAAITMAEMVLGRGCLARPGAGIMDVARRADR